MGFEERGTAEVMIRINEGKECLRLTLTTYCRLAAGSPCCLLISTRPITALRSAQASLAWASSFNGVEVRNAASPFSASFAMPQLHRGAAFVSAFAGLVNPVAANGTFAISPTHHGLSAHLA